jgi:glycerophosphoryl diester phosphodiesterase
MTETTKRTTKVWAHRGASGYRPENTLEAFDRAQTESNWMYILPQTVNSSLCTTKT